jgi:serine/threonine-protein kinase
MFTKAKAAALQALRLDEGLSQAHAALAYIRLSHDWDWAETDKECRRALELNPDDPLAHFASAMVSIVKGDFDGAFAEVRRAVVSPAFNLQWAGQLFLAGKYDQAIEQLKKTLELDPSIMPTRMVLASLYAFRGMYAEAMAECEKIRMLRGGEWPSRAALGFVYALAGRHDEARNILEELKPLIRESRILCFRAAIICAALDDRDQAFALLEKLFEERFFMMIYVNAPPVLRESALGPAIRGSPAPHQPAALNTNAISVLFRSFPGRFCVTTVIDFAFAARPAWRPKFYSPISVQVRL